MEGCIEGCMEGLRYAEKIAHCLYLIVCSTYSGNTPAVSIEFYIIL